MSDSVSDVDHLIFVRCSNEEAIVDALEGRGGSALPKRMAAKAAAAILP
jgi:hypothetical protein